MAAPPYTNRYVFATLPRTERGQPIVLGADPKGKNFLYCHGNSVIIRNLENPQFADVYTQHSCQVNVAKYSPSGFYIASADKSGKVRIWDTVNKEHILKNEFQPISGPIKDLSWSPDNQRIVVVGEGRERFGHVFLAETGTSNGDITGQSRPVNTCDFRPARPFRIITGSEDNTSAVYEGPPFKFKGTKGDHARYCQVVRYSPDGAFWASGGFDGKIFLYEGKDSELIGELIDTKAAHDGGVYGLSWSPDGKKLLSASGDKSCKIWDVETKTVISKFVLGTDVQDQQLSCLWSGDYLLSVSLSGRINFLDPKDPSKPCRVIEGHSKPITSMETGYDSGRSLFTSSSDGKVIRWNTEDGTAQVVNGVGHNSQVNALKKGGDNKILSIGLDDCMRFMNVDQNTYDQVCTKLNAQPKDIDQVQDLVGVVTSKGVVLVSKSGSTILEETLSFEPTCIGISSVNHCIVVGSSENALHVYQNNGDKLEEMKTVALSGTPTSVKFSPDQKYLVVTDTNRKVTLLHVGTFEKANNKEWGFHTARVNCVAWAPNSLYVASGGLDCSVILWSVEAPEKHCIFQSAHVQSQITGIRWLDNATVVSCGQDGNVKIWNVNWP